MRLTLKSNTRMQSPQTTNTIHRQAHTNLPTNEMALVAHKNRKTLTYLSKPRRFGPKKLTQFITLNF
ncbi:hypothetical protein AA18895_0509 [Acetobacter ghanensis DSM 18895]|nr:hypothetical protein AA18895_0509 [Acetobacter ghanensis DSM 18895]